MQLLQSERMREVPGATLAIGIRFPGCYEQKIFSKISIRSAFRGKFPLKLMPRSWNLQV